MKLFDFLFGRTPRIEDPAPAILISDQAGSVPDWTPPHETQAVLADESVPDTPGFGAAAFWAAKTKTATDPVFCMIDYTDAAGVRSRRRITIRSIVHDEGTAWVAGYCHERAAPRRFRVDRIQCFITQDGEIIAPSAFLEAMCGFSVNPAMTDHSKGDRKQASKAYIDRIRPALTVLIAASRSDDHVHNEEIDAIMLYAEKEGLALVQAGRLPAVPEISTLDSLHARISRTRPVREDVAKALLRISEWDEPRFDRFCKGLRAVVHADGIVAHGESLFLDDLDAVYRARWAALAPELEAMIASSRVFLDMEG